MLVADADKLMSKLSTDKIAGFPSQTLAQQVAGTRVLVPAFLAGAPDCMLRLTTEDRPVRHIRMFVNVASAASLPCEKLLVRGAAILGLVELLQSQQIGVDLALVYCPTDRDVFVINVESRPIDISTAAFAVGHPAFAREVGYTLANKRYGHCGGYVDSQSIMACLKCEKTDIYVPRADYGDGLSEDPEGWLQKRIVQVTGGVEL
jgi:hypothetical protein